MTKKFSFKNGSSIVTIETEKRTCRGQRAKLYPIDNESDYLVPRNILGDVVIPFIAKKQSDKLDKQITYFSSVKRMK